ncbi:choice-of-anchor P family protein [Nocardioides sp.]|uniref:choice-of-anchor P family protein n=1 Tax=Nocardioides sp. TaxID=35761 RepID=UPI003527C1B6
MTRTAYAMSAAGFGTRVRGGDVPVSSGTSSYDAIGCTNKAGVAHGEHVESVDLAGLGTATGVDTQVSTVRSGGTTKAVSTHSVAEVTVADTVAGTVSIKAITSTARAWHNASGYHGDAGTTIGSITLTPLAGPAVALDVPTVGHPLVVPGVLTLSMGDPKLGGGSRGAWARTTGLLLTVPGTDTRVEIARAKATISGGVTVGLFRGSSYAVDADALGGTATVGRHPLSLMPCQGTDGKARRKAMTTVDLGALVVDTLTSRQVADQESGRAWGRESATVARVDVGDGALVIRDIVAQAHAVRTRSGVRTDARGTGLGDIRVDGHRVRLPASGRLRVPGVAKIETKVVTRGKDKISVVGLRLTLLDGSGAVVDLARANVQVLPSGR